MSQFRHGNAARDAHIMTLRIMIGVLVLNLLVAMGGWYQARQDLTIHNPPDLRSGSTRAWWKVPPSTVYSFGLYIWQQINHWPKDGQTDYKANLERYSAYLTPSCRHQLNANYERRIGRHELSDRVRTLSEIPGHGYQPSDVTVLDRDHWVVALTAQINEYVHGMSVRNLAIQYYLQIERADVDPESNPFGLQLDCFARPAQRLSLTDQTDSSNTHSASPAEAGLEDDQ
ncbi:PFL_4703 family integrating conjugative element protein [Salinisphaera hydrothermalis]|uniref:Integrating conjugative element protein n=1 Tax=Salinisphaera hydrothermalis (strain C41B8) TaxID=1304275 RepID=A0A084IJ06_SALHC|nr:TIGR03746 family integrating conjugative element protein [Salinisphaera hydrothermalis]KEZ76690.1 hypothetical protein C41B8_13785 [Salinisphaera hydrothermalis C41B8]